RPHRADTPYYYGKHKRHGMNVQVLTDPLGRLPWASSALPRSTHDLAAARQQRHHRSPRRCGTQMLHGQGVSRRRRTRPPTVSGPPPQAMEASPQHHPRQDQCLGERAMATIKGWRLQRKLRRSTNRITDVVKALLVLHHASA
ncbi:transposase family protein, partial [Streptomyces sp. NPDC000349]|uniref:transposase family protein n=1 Tax=Streptomyces sp. NPDC000349 TaxID=3154249 RepID=UPI00336A417E